MDRAILTFSSRNYWPSTYVQLKALEYVKCPTPVVLYHPACDQPPKVIAERCECRTTESAIGVDASVFRQWQRTEIILRCNIREVLVIGSDVYPCRDPSPCFESLTQRAMFVEEKPAIFWREIPLGCAFEPYIYDLPPEAKDETFTPQGDTILIDTVRCQRAIELVNWFNQREHYYYKFGWGDQTQWRAAWALLGMKQYSYVNECVDWSRHYVYVHQGWDGLPLFVHRTGAKFADDGVFNLPLRRFDDLPLEADAFGWYQEFKAL